MSSLPRVKICGLTRLEDAKLCEQLGADALGFVFVEASKRFIEPQQAKIISDHLGPFITRVGLFLNAAPEQVEQVLKLMPNLVPQFHGQESPEECERYGVPYLKAIGLGAGMPPEAELLGYENAAAFLFDSNAPGELGGTGHTFDWAQLAQANVGKPVILAGGLSAENVQDAITQVQPYALDLSSGVELSKGIKDHVALRTFFNAVQQSTGIIRDSVQDS